MPVNWSLRRTAASGGDRRQPARRHQGQQVAGAAHLLGDVGVDPRRAGDLRPQRPRDQHLEHDHAHGQGGRGVQPLVPQGVPVGRHQQDEQDQAEQHHAGEHLGAGQQLRGRDRAEAHPEPDRRPALAVEDLVEQDEQPRQEEDQDQVGVVGVPDHRRREAVDQPAAGGRAVAGHVAVDRQIGAPGREAVGQGDEHVEGQHRPEEQGQRRQQQAGQRHPGVPHQVDAVGVVEVVADQGRDAAPGGERRPAQEPGEEPGVADAAPSVRVAGEVQTDASSSTASPRNPSSTSSWTRTARTRPSRTGRARRSAGEPAWSAAGSVASLNVPAFRTSPS